MKKLTLFFLALIAMCQMQAQPGGGRMMQVSSPVVNPDNTVTFNYRDANAKQVLVDVQFAGRHEMVKDRKSTRLNSSHAT